MEEDETNCRYASSRGILKSCQIRSSSPQSSIRFLKDYPEKIQIQEGRALVFYVCNAALSHFFNTIMRTITYPFVLVSGDSDDTIPIDVFPNRQLFQDFVNHTLLVHWFCQNCIVSHPKITHLTIGLDYHTLTYHHIYWGPLMSSLKQEEELMQIQKMGKKLENRNESIYVNFIINPQQVKKYDYDRKDALSSIDPSLMVREKENQTRAESWKNQIQHAFVLSPHGNGLDCHRTWEALVLGCIPIVKRSGLSLLYKDLPVLIVDDWKQITSDLLKETIVAFTDLFTKGSFKLEKLELKYWLQLIEKASII